MPATFGITLTGVGRIRRGIIIRIFSVAAVHNAGSGMTQVVHIAGDGECALKQQSENGRHHHRGSSPFTLSCASAHGLQGYRYKRCYTMTRTAERTFATPLLTGVGAFYFALTKASVVSSMRLEKPHSLSYQLHTLTRVPPITWVSVLS